MIQVSSPSGSRGGNDPQVFCGDAAAAARRAALLLLVVGPIPAVMLFGQKAVWLFPLASIPAGMCLAGLYLLLKRIDRLELDDSAEMIVPSIGRPIAYRAVQAVRFEPDAGLTRVTCRAGILRARPLLQAADADQAGQLRRALRERCPEAAISDKPRSAAKAGALVAALLIALHAGFLYYFRETWPVIKAPCKDFVWLGAAPAEPVREYELDGMRYSLPARYEPVFDSSQTETHRYRDSAAGQEIRVHSARLTQWLADSNPSSTGGGRGSGPLGAAPLRLLGIGSTYDLMRWTYSDRIGAIPVIMKAALIPPGKEPWELKIYEAEAAGRKALIQTESSPGDYSAYILASSNYGQDELLVALAAEQSINRQLIAVLLGGLGLVPE